MPPRLQFAIDLLRTARFYTLDMLDNVPPEDWFRQPTEGVTHVAWQVGHLAMVEYALCMRRVRGVRPEDAELISDEFMAPFRKGSTPTADPADYSDPEEIRRVLDRVHDQTLEELPTLTEENLDESSGAPHPMFKTKLEAITWCAQHEMIHVGQIGLLRRLFGSSALR